MSLFEWAPRSVEPTLFTAMRPEAVAKWCSSLGLNVTFFPPVAVRDRRLCNHPYCPNQSDAKWYCTFQFRRKKRKLRRNFKFITSTWKCYQLSAIWRVVLVSPSTPHSPKSKIGVPSFFPPKSFWYHTNVIYIQGQWRAARVFALNNLCDKRMEQAPFQRNGRGAISIAGRAGSIFHTAQTCARWNFVENLF